MIGKILGNRYLILEEVGGGGMAVVYKARCELLNRIVAVKVLRPEFSNDEEFVRRFRREAQAAASLSHPNIVGIYDVGDEDGIYYIVMEYVEGKTLKEVIKEKAPMDPVDVLEIGIQICEALECAHKNKIIHRDIKSPNIICNSDGRIKVTDFGIARAAGGATITNTGNVFGSVHYFSPEQAKGEIVDERSDLYSVGIILYEALTGQVPFDGQSPVSVALKQIQDQPEPISTLIPGFPEKLEQVIHKCLAKSPNERFQSAKELKDSLTALLSDSEVAYFKPDLMEHTLILNKVPENKLNHKSDTPSKKGKNVSNIQRKKTGLLKGLGIAVAVAVLFFAFSFLGGTLAKRYFDVPEVVVPSVIGLTEEQAKEKLAEVNLKYKIVDEVYDSAPAGEIIDQDPKGGTSVKANHPPIELVISKGPKVKKVPAIVGLNESEGISLIRSEGFEVGLISRKNSDTDPEGVIIDQNPRDGLALPAGTTINFTVSLGPKTKQSDIPILIGQTLDEAINLLKERNIPYNVIKKPSEAPENTVIDQSPKPGETISSNVTVDLLVSSGPVKTKKKVLNIKLPPEPDEFTITVTVSDDLGKRQVYKNTHTPEDSPLKVEVEGSGVMDVEVWLDDKLFHKKDY